MLGPSWQEGPGYDLPAGAGPFYVDFACSPCVRMGFLRVLRFPPPSKHAYRCISSQYPWPRYWLRIWSWSTGAVLWLPTAPQGWVKCRDQILLCIVYMWPIKVPLWTWITIQKWFIVTSSWWDRDNAEGRGMMWQRNEKTTEHHHQWGITACSQNFVTCYLVNKGLFLFFSPTKLELIVVEEWKNKPRLFWWVLFYFRWASVKCDLWQVNEANYFFLAQQKLEFRGYTVFFFPCLIRKNDGRGFLLLTFCEFILLFFKTKTAKWACEILHTSHSQIRFTSYT